MSAAVTIPPRLDALVDAPSDIDKFDVAILNLLAAAGLPGTENLDISALLDKLDEWAHVSKLHTASQMHRFRWMKLQEKSDFTVGDSLARYCCYCMLEALQLKCGVRYNPTRTFTPDLCLPADVFIHGILQENGNGGTCASMPVVYVAIGHRLGYPVYLNHTKGHLYFCWKSETDTHVEWESPPYSMSVPADSFNVEGTAEGYAFHSDAFYIQWPTLLTVEDFELNTYLRPQTPRENFAAFLIERAHFLFDLGRYEEALDTVFKARRLCPADKRYKAVHSQMTVRCLDAEVTRQDALEELDYRRLERLIQDQEMTPGERIQRQNRMMEWQRHREERRTQLRQRLLDQCRVDPIAKLIVAKE